MGEESQQLRDDDSWDDDSWDDSWDDDSWDDSWDWDDDSWDDDSWDDSWDDATALRCFGRWVAGGEGVPRVP